MGKLVFQRQVQGLPEQCLQCGRYVDKRQEAVLLSRWSFDRSAVEFGGPWCSQECYEAYAKSREGTEDASP